MNHLDYLAFRRKIIFWDEWLLYVTLMYVYAAYGTILTVMIGLFGSPLIILSYIHLNTLEAAYQIYSSDPKTNQVFRPTRLVKSIITTEK